MSSSSSSSSSSKASSSSTSTSMTMTAARTMTVTLRCALEVPLAAGQSLHVVGDRDELGNWQPALAIPLTLVIPTATAAATGGATLSAAARESVTGMTGRATLDAKAFMAVFRAAATTHHSAA